MKKFTKIINILTVVIASLIIFGFGFFETIKPDIKYSDSERRLLEQKPNLRIEDIANGKFMSDFENYTLDQFPLRDSFRKIKAISSVYVFGQKANNGLYSVNGYLSKLEFPENTEKIRLSTDKLTGVYDKYIKNSNCKVYLSIIPDKNCFLAPLGGYPSMDYGSVVDAVKNQMSFAEYIDIFDKLELNDYYYTDQHWRQEKIIDVAETVATSMGGKITKDFDVNILDTPLYGAYVGQSALKFDGDEVKYLTNDIINSCSVTSYSTGSPENVEIYDFEKASGKDAYEFFLSGSEPFLTIENPRFEGEKELVIFRDSFSSSLAPLLTSAYSKITLIDLRYMKADLIGGFINFDSQDVLFLYSTLVLNNSVSM